MGATPLATTERFFAPEISKVYYALTLADYTAPVRPELDAATDFTDEMASVTGWSVDGRMLDTPDWGRRFVSQISGRTSAGESSITFYADKAGVDVRAVLARGDVGNVIFCDGGDVTGYLADVFKTEVTSVGKVRTGTDGALVITVKFAITKAPAENVVLPATA